MTRWPWYAATLGAAHLLKRHYATASADELRWVLDPTAWLVGASTGTASTFEAGVGHLFVELGLILAPECAGINFLVIASCSVVFAFGPTRVTPSAMGALVAGSFAVAYLATLAINALRVVALVGLAPGPALHRALGVAVYLGALLALHAVARRALEAGCSAPRSSGT